MAYLDGRMFESGKIKFISDNFVFQSARELRSMRDDAKPKTDLWKKYNYNAESAHWA